MKFFDDRLMKVLLCVTFCGLFTSVLRGDDPPSAVGPLMKLFQSGRLPAERQGAVVEMICNRGNEHDLRVVFDKVVAAEGLPAELRPKAIGWLTDAAVTRKVKPAGELGGAGKPRCRSGGSERTCVATRSITSGCRVEGHAHHSRSAKTGA